MNKNFYNEEESQFQELRAVLKDLPKINADKNFEYNLMTRIHNKQFESKSLKKSHFTLFGFLKPALAVGVVAIISFIVIQNQNSEIENPFSIQPEIRSEGTAENNGDTAPNEFVVSEKVSRKSNNEVDKEVSSPKRFIIQDNDVIAAANEEFPFPDNSFDLDSKLKSSVIKPNFYSRSTLAGSGNINRNSNRVYFEGFYTGSNTTKKIIDSLRNEHFKDSVSTSEKNEKSKR
jgi:hypothetical protein